MFHLVSSLAQFIVHAASTHLSTAPNNTAIRTTQGTKCNRERDGESEREREI